MVDLSGIMQTISLARYRRLTLLLIVLLPVLAVRADDPLPPNLGRGLDKLVERNQTQPAAQTDAERSAALLAHLGRNAERVQVDEQGRVTVNIRLDGSVPAEDVKKSLNALGLTIIGEYIAKRPDGRDGVLSAHLSLAQAAAVAKTRGVFSVLAAHGPRRRIGKVTSQGVSVLHADEVQAAGYEGKGITIGALSDSFNVATAQSVYVSTGVRSPVSTNAQEDIASGDLPGPGNPNGHTTPVYVLQDGSSNPSQGNTDEGRAMLQIVFDLAPAANLAFCTAGETETQFANNIKAMRTNPKVNADILVDDIGYDDEPFFSDGIISQAVEDVVTSTSLPGHQVLYYSAAGNDGDLGYAATFTAVTNSAARAGRAGTNNLQLGQVPNDLTENGFHNFGAVAGSGTSIVQQVTVSGDDAIFNFQWDDPFVPGMITANYNLLVFDENGNYLAHVSSTENNFSTGEAFQEVDLPATVDGGNGNTIYQIAISLGRTQGTPATHLRYISEGDGALIGPYFQMNVPSLFGHPGAADADGIAAYAYNALGTPEDYDSFGPVTIYFDALGNRLATPEVRDQPTMAAVDGVDTTFFPEGPLAQTDANNTGFPAFFGTSAAAPHVAGAAALLLEAAGGAGKLNAAQMRSLLQGSAGTHDLTPGEATATFNSADGRFHVSLLAQGDPSDVSAFSNRFFTLSFTGPAGSSLTAAAINIGPGGEDYDISPDVGSLATGTGGYPFTIGLAQGVDASGITSTLGPNNAGTPRTKLTVHATRGSFPPSGVLSFGIDRNAIATMDSGNDADLLAGSVINVTFIRPDGKTDTATGTLVNDIGHGYSPDVGFGLINVDAALQSVLGK